ncbi:hypothetical protein [Methanobrevibacter cuticularis]|uniref:hypothetical protein n=1 Tax=Methanobrevibacter cuticularis TaxID=47311 RepID=UPI0012EDAC48|nr:hypothetical protein [Methanobrevibacter cuticularis]
MNLLYNTKESVEYAANDLSTSRFTYICNRFFTSYKLFLRHMSCSIIDFMC